MLHGVRLYHPPLSVCHAVYYDWRPAPLLPCDQTYVGLVLFLKTHSHLPRVSPSSMLEKGFLFEFFFLFFPASGVSASPALL